MIAQDTLLQKYGKPDGKYQQKYCTIWQIDNDFPWFPAKKFMINSDFKDLLTVAFKSIEAAGLQSEIDFFDGCYSYRASRTTGNLSLHAWAAAIDLNAAKEKLHQLTTNWTPEFLKCMTDAGVFWGGNFNHIKDPMHFALLDG